ncbi:oxidoreductase [Glaciihabitans arcticus]|uniref:Oxidoreductase n=1 Tax=Glaciihabitans arcticus TaxID=2668039 RepID=A0A4Q9GST8_9MICO|nr:oxidoreductase [Glaciihabitans arcticus]TBN57741.1 oxidoreductase [Glaciihabitans arcticus]
MRKASGFLGAVTMYKLVLGLLIALFALSLVLSLLGVLPYAPLAILASWAVSVGVSVGSSWAFGRAFGAKAHLESAAITGLLLLFILRPELSVESLLILALAAFLASASKYLLAVRGRHIFNPAAIGAVLVTATGLTFSGWWVSSPAMLPLVAIGALLILYRTRRLAMGLTFIGTVLVIDVVLSLTRGLTVPDGLSLAILGTSTVFFAGFMLSEPLTLPPRRMQQLALAVIVALLFAVPFNLLAVYSSPQLALVIGNLFAFLVGQRRGLRLILLEKTQLTPTSWEFSFQPSRPVFFHPGQYMELGIPHASADIRGQRRIFSISSAPGEGAPVSIAIKVSPRSSSFKTAMLALEPGERVYATSVGGDFLLPSDPAVPVLLVAGGIGVTPFASQLAHATSAGEQRDIVVIYAVAAGEELVYAEQLTASGARVLVVCPEPPVALPEGWEYLGSRRIDADLLREAVPDLADRHAFVSGPPALVTGVRQALRTEKARRVTTDYFSGY